MSDTRDRRPGWGQEGYAAWMDLALEEARAVAASGDASSGTSGDASGHASGDPSGDASGDVPIGAVVVSPTGEVLGRGRNVREALADPTGHAEIIALREAGATTGQWRLEGCTLVVTLEPCAMCAGAAVLSRIDRIVFGAWDEKAGACGSVWDLPRDRRALHRPEVVGGVREAECVRLLLDFFGERRVGGRAGRGGGRGGEPDEVRGPPT